MFFNVARKFPPSPYFFFFLFRFVEIMIIDNQLSWNVLPFLCSPTDQLCLGKPWL